MAENSRGSREIKRNDNQLSPCIVEVLNRQGKYRVFLMAQTTRTKVRDARNDNQLSPGKGAVDSLT